MVTIVIKKIIGQCMRYAWLVVAAAALLTVGSSWYAVRHFAINTDIGKLISSDSPWWQRELALYEAFPQRVESILAVVEAPTPELVGQASAALVERLSREPRLFRSVHDTVGSPFFAHNALLFLSTDEVEQTTSRLDEMAPLIQTLATDPSLRGLTQALSLVLVATRAGHFALDDIAGPLTKFAIPLEDVLTGRSATFSWQGLLKGESAGLSDRPHFIEIRPVLDFGALEPGKAATDAIRQAVMDLQLGSRFRARVRLTGPVPIADEEFGTVKEGALPNAIGTIAIVLTILWLALRSARIIFAVALTVVIGLSITAAVGLMMVGALNLISIAFAVLFVGIGVDFAIQFSVRYRAERHEIDDLHAAVISAAERAGKPLTLAAAATAAGFLSFLPTEYRGVSELGQIAGVGMIIAFATSITVLPALLAILKPPGEEEPLGYAALAPIDRFLERHRIAVLAWTGLVILAGLPLLHFLQFDFNPINLRSPKVESIATYLDLRNDPATGASSVDVLAPSTDAARDIADRLSKLPEVSRVMTIDSFVPQDQEKKLSLIRDLAQSLEHGLQENTQESPTDAEKVAALKEAERELVQTAANRSGPAVEAVKRLAAAVSQLANANESTRSQAESVLVSPLKVTLHGLRASLRPQPASVETLPAEIKWEWVTEDGRARVQVLPKGDPNENETLRQFARAVLAVEPSATGGPIFILETGEMMVTAFIQAGAFAVISISILLCLILRRIGDVLLTLIPLILAGVVTLEICVLLGIKLNFANIIALPLLLGIGVAFKIYYISAWRAGQTNLLQSILTRAVFYSALTTAIAFGSLWLSSHPGTSSMGKLLALSLVCTLVAAVLFQPVLMGPPREKAN